jgi:hypothetical protein
MEADGRPSTKAAREMAKETKDGVVRLERESVIPIHKPRLVMKLAYLIGICISFPVADGLFSWFDPVPASRFWIYFFRRVDSKLFFISFLSSRCPILAAAVMILCTYLLLRHYQSYISSSQFWIDWSRRELEPDSTYNSCSWLLHCHITDMLRL